MERVLKQVAKLLASNTNYATLVTASSANRIKFIQLSQVVEGQILAVVVMNNNMVKNQIINVTDEIDNETMLKLNILLNTALNGQAIQDINLATIAKLKEQAGSHSAIVGEVIDALGEILREDDSLEIYTSGATNILKYPELSDSEQVTSLLSAFEEKDELASLVSESLNSEETGIQVYIGNEAPVQTMKDCSVVTATYELGEGVKGTIGIIGPKRMDYEKVMDNLRNLKSQLDGILDKPKDHS
jgi:heat-inducible transcriptional repressor